MKKVYFWLMCLLMTLSLSSCNPTVFPKDETKIETDAWQPGNLDHDIYVNGCHQICDVKKTGFEPYVGPTGWPMVDPVEWEVALWEDSTYYYSRMIFHEWVLWWSFDDPYMLVKFPKSTVNGDLATDEKLRWQTLWDLMHPCYRTWDFKPWCINAEVYHINGHSVYINGNQFHYEKYVVVSDPNHSW